METNIIEARGVAASFGSRRDYPRRGVTVLTGYVRADKPAPAGWHSGRSGTVYFRSGQKGRHPVSIVAEALAPLTIGEKGVFVDLNEVTVVHAREVQRLIRAHGYTPEKALGHYQARAKVYVHRVRAVLPTAAVDALTTKDAKRPWWVSFHPEVIRRHTEAAEKYFPEGKVVINTAGVCKLLAQGVAAMWPSPFSSEEGMAGEYRLYHGVMNDLFYGVITHPVEGNYVTTGEVASWLRGNGHNVWADPSIVERVARWSGWLKTAAAECPTVTRVFRVGVTRRSRKIGFGYSFRERINIFQMMDVFRTPHQLERKLWKVRRRADAILSAYEGDYHPSWLDITRAVLLTPSVGKAAVIAVATTLTGQRPRKAAYRSARERLVQYRVGTVRDKSDGVVGRREVEPYYTADNGTSVYRLFVLEKGRNRVLALVVSPIGRTYHSEHLYGECVVEEAERAWEKQDAAAEENASVVAYLDGAEFDFCPLFSREDSRQAGNCLFGTESWVGQRGWGARSFIPGVWLIPHLSDERVLRVARLARARALRTTQEEGSSAV